MIGTPRCTSRFSKGTFVRWAWCSAQRTEASGPAGVPSFEPVEVAADELAPLHPTTLAQPPPLAGDPAPGGPRSKRPVPLLRSGLGQQPLGEEGEHLVEGAAGRGAWAVVEIPVRTECACFLWP